MEPERVLRPTYACYVFEVEAEHIFVHRVIAPFGMTIGREEEVKQRKQAYRRTTGSILHYLSSHLGEGGGGCP